MTIESSATATPSLNISFTGDLDRVGSWSIELIGLRDNSSSVSVPGAVIDARAGTVRVPGGTSNITIVLKHAPAMTD